MRRRHAAGKDFGRVTTSCAGKPRVLGPRSIQPQPALSVEQKRLAPTQKCGLIGALGGLELREEPYGATHRRDA
jgi:hypothetical protein